MTELWRIVAKLLRLIEDWQRRREYERMREEYRDLEDDPGDWFDRHFRSDGLRKLSDARKAAEARADKDRDSGD